MHRDVETLLGRLATDPELLASFAADPAALLGELRAHGLELTEVEREALSRLDAAAVRRLSDALDPRLRRTPRAADLRLAGEVPPSTTTRS